MDRGAWWATVHRVSKSWTWLSTHGSVFNNVCVLSHSFVSNSLWSHGLYPARLLSPWNFPGKTNGVGCNSLLQGIFPTQGLKLHILHLLYWQVYSLSLCPLENPTVNYSHQICSQGANRSPFLGSVMVALMVSFAGFHYSWSLWSCTGPCWFEVPLLVFTDWL